MFGSTPGRIFGRDLGPNCLQRLSADDTCRLKVEFGHIANPNESDYYFSDIAHGSN